MCFWIEFKKLRPNAIIPAYQTPGSSGMDLHSAEMDPVTIQPGRRLCIPTGIAMSVNDQWEGQVRSRSGLAAKHGIAVLNAPGTIDADYTGEVIVILANFGEAPYTIEPGERIAQLVIAPVSRPIIGEVAELSPTMRGAGGFGSTGR
jgi:dUTP pyrophosphatase